MRPLTVLAKSAVKPPGFSGYGNRQSGRAHYTRGFPVWYRSVLAAASKEATSSIDIRALLALRSMKI
jgi:hypothetical protein